MATCLSPRSSGAADVRDSAASVCTDVEFDIAETGMRVDHDSVSMNDGASPGASPVASPGASPGASPVASSPGASAVASTDHDFYDAPDALDDRVLGENRHPMLHDPGDDLVRLFYTLAPGYSDESIEKALEDMLEKAHAGGDVATVKNIFLLVFQSRWCRGGKAFKRAFYKTLVFLYRKFPTVVLDLMHLIPVYGYWKDLLSLLTHCPEATGVYENMHAKVWSLFAEQLRSDMLESLRAREEHRAPKISLCAKFAPSEGCSFSKKLRADREICKILFPSCTDAAGAPDHVNAKYRRLLTSLRKELHVPETFMCAQRWCEIEFSRVSSLALDRHKCAFLNEHKNGTIKLPSDVDRSACRENFLQTLVAKGVKGAQMMPHELVAQVLLEHALPMRCADSVCPTPSRELTQCVRRC